jgi:DNA-binding NarL/FixJ family response regulator
VRTPIPTGDAWERRDTADGWRAGGGLTGSVVAVREALRQAPVNIRRAADPVGMGVVTDDPAAAAPIIARLRARPELGVRHVLPPRRADVILALATTLSGGLLAELTSLAGQAGSPGQCVVLVADPIRESLLGPLIGCGVVSILPWRGVTAELVAQAVLASHAGRAILPSTVARWLVDEARLTRHEPAVAAGPGPDGLSEREIGVLRLLADGQDTAQIAAHLRYSERTIKKILQDLTTRLQLRNRTHAVSYALRIGAI